MLKAVDQMFIETLQSKFHFTTHFIDKLSKAGVLLPTGRYSGIVGSVYEQEAQLGVCAITWTSERTRFVDFLHFTHVEHVAFMSLKPNGQLVDNQLILSPFSYAVWLFMAGTMVTLSLIIRGHRLLARRGWITGEWMEKNSLILHSYLDVYAIITNQSKRGGDFLFFF